MMSSLGLCIDESSILAENVEEEIRERLEKRLSVCV